ncbi:MAG: hypothetical protein JWP12_1074 [Bacteroidetes bacterium]|nr:hypothetical protein [Bacteroidota bacterium]
MSSIVNDIKQRIKSGDAVTRLIIISISFFLFAGIFRILVFVSGSAPSVVSAQEFLIQNVSVRFNFAALLQKPWTLITFMFSHFEFAPLFWNMIALYLFGKILSDYTSPKKIIPLYILGGVAGALIAMMLITFIPGFQGYSGNWLTGASASVTAIIVAAATLVPNVRLNLVLLGPVKLLYLALFFILIDILNLASYANLGGNLSHLGGALMGYLFIVQYKKGKDMATPFNRFFDWISGLFNRSSKSKMKVIHKRNLTDEEYNYNKIVNQKQLDAILDKISKSGYESLSKMEKEMLFRESGRK